MSVAHNIHANFKAKMSKHKARLPISVQKVEMASNNIARLLVAIPDVFRKSLTNEELAHTVEKNMPGVRYLSNSLSAAESEGLYTLFVANTPKVMSKEAASAVVLREVGSANNVFRDDEDNIWDFVEGANGNDGYFIAKTIEDLESLILGVRSRNANIATASLEIAMAETFSKGTPIVVYDTATEKHDFGIGVSDTEAYFPDSEAIKLVHPTLVVAAYEQAAGSKGMPVINFDKANKKQVVLDYYRALYGQNAAYYKKIEALVRQHLNV